MHINYRHTTSNAFALRFSTQAVIFIICLLFITDAFAQDQNSLQGFGIEANVLSGRIVRQTSRFQGPIPASSNAFDLNFVWQTYGKKDWQQRRNFPLIGIGATYTDYGMNQVYGNCIGIYPNIQIPLIRGKNLEWTFRLGDGLGYVTKKYQTTAPIDTLNDAIGSHLDDFGVFMMDLRMHFDDHWQFQLGANFTHISNADYHQPNQGVNMAGLHLGVQYFPVTDRPKHIIRELPKLSNRWLFEFRYGMSFKEARAPKIGDPIAPAYHGTGYVSRRWLSKNKLFAGIDYAYHKDVYDFLINYEVDYGHAKAHSWDGAFLIGNEFLEGRVGFVTQLGVYYHQTYLKFDAVYEKIGVNFYLIQKEHGPVKELFLSAMLLTHEIVAEYAEFGIGAGF